jgi:hypothetical protein
MSKALWRNQIRNGVSISTAVQLPRMATPNRTDVLLTVSACTGAPTAASLRAYFEVLQPTSGGAMTDAYPGGMWTRVDADMHPNSLPDGDWPTQIADQTTTSQAIDKMVISSGSTAISIGAGGSQPAAPFAVGQRLSGSHIWMGASNEIVTVGSGGAAGTLGSSATLRYPAINNDTNSVGVLYTNPVQVKRSIVGFPCWRLVLIPTFTGGTTPAFVVSVSTVTE